MRVASRAKPELQSVPLQTSRKENTVAAATAEQKAPLTTRPSRELPSRLRSAAARPAAEPKSSEPAAWTRRGAAVLSIRLPDVILLLRQS